MSADKPKVKKAVRDTLDGWHDKYDIKQTWRKGNVSTGILTLDLATTKGGIPRGLLIDFYGDEGLGKSTMCLVMAAECVRRGEHVVYIDVEKSLSPELVEAIIPDQELFEVFHPATGEEALALVEKSMKIPEIRMVVVDSVAALIFEEDMAEDKDTEVSKVQRQLGLLARRVGYFSAKLMSSMFEYGGIVVFVNQTREKVNLGYGKPGKIQTGGTALRFYSHLRLGIYGEEISKDADGFAEGRKVRLHIKKNKFGAPERDATTSVQFGRGINRVRDLIDCGIELGVIKQAGAFYQLKQLDAKGKVIREINGHGEEDFAKKVVPVLDELRESVRLMIVAKAKAKLDAEQKQRVDDLAAQKEHQEALRNKPPEMLAPVEPEDKKK